MRSRSIALAAVFAVLLNAVVFAGDNDKVRGKAKKRQVSRLVTLLPASDAVAVLDSRRFLNESLPRVLTANQPLLGKMTAHLTEIETRTGIDLRKFDQVAVGVTYKQISPKETDYDTVVLATGDVNAGALVGVAKLASSGTYREEKVGNRFMWVFTPKAVVQKTGGTSANSKIGAVTDPLVKGFSKEIAIASIERNTVAIGTPSRVRETLEAASHPAAEITSLLAARSDAVASFAGRVPNGMSSVLPMDNDELGNSIQSIQMMAGSIDTTIAGATLQMMAQTKRPDQAAALKDTLDGLQSIGGAVLGNSKRADQQIYGRMIKSARFTTLGSSVTLDLSVPQADIDALIATIK